MWETHAPHPHTVRLGVANNADYFEYTVNDASACLCRFVVNEMVQSEKDYVKDLGVIVEVRH